MTWWVRFCHGADRVEAQTAKLSARRSVTEAKKRSQDVTELVTRLEGIAEKNHFVERLNLHVKGD